MASEPPPAKPQVARAGLREPYHWFRRLMHMLLVCSLAYYWVPDPVPILFLDKRLAALSGVAVVAALEAWRIRKGWAFALFRDYERKWVAGYFWYGAGCVFALVAFEPRFAVPAILGVAFVDPLLGELRETRAKRSAPAAGLVIWAGLAAGAVLLAGVPTPLSLIPVGAAAAVAAETTKVPRVDDNFLMIAAPLLAMQLVAVALGI